MKTKQLVLTWSTELAARLRHDAHHRRLCRRPKMRAFVAEFCAEACPRPYSRAWTSGPCFHASFVPAYVAWCEAQGFRLNGAACARGAPSVAGSRAGKISHCKQMGDSGLEWMTGLYLEAHSLCKPGRQRLRHGSGWQQSRQNFTLQADGR